MTNHKYKVLTQIHVQSAFKNEMLNDNSARCRSCRTVLVPHSWKESQCWPELHGTANSFCCQ